MATDLELTDAMSVAWRYVRPRGEGSGALRYFARTGIIGQGLRNYLTDARANVEDMPIDLAWLANYVRNH